MTRGTALCFSMAVILLLGGCLGDTSNELAIPKLHFNNGGTSSVSPQFAALGGAVPAGAQATFIGDVITIRGIHFRDDMKVFFGMNTQLARRPDSIMTTARHLLPGEPFVYTDPVTSQQTILEVDSKVEYIKENEARITVPPGVACHASFTDPIIRLFGDAGSGPPIEGVYFIVGPRCIALTPNKGVDVGGYSVIVHGDFFSPYTQVAFRYRDPATDQVVVIGDHAGTDIVELFVDRHTLILPNFPGVVPNSTLGLADELPVDILLFENIDEITGSLALEPGLEGSPPCDDLRPESPEAPLQTRGVRNSEKANAFTFLPTGVTDYPLIASVLPESGAEIGGNTVVIHGDQFDAFTTDLSNPADPGVGIECPPGSGQFVAPLDAVLVDRQTLVIKMPPCPVDIPEKVAFCLRNKFSIDNPGGAPSVGPAGNCVLFEEVYTYLPIPPIAPPIVTAIYPADETPGPGMANDYGLQRLMVVGDWFDFDTTLNGGFEFLLPNEAGGDPIPVQAERVILHNRNLLEVYTPRLPANFYPLTADMVAGVRVRNALARDPILNSDPSLEDVIGHADYAAALVFKATPDAGAPPVLDAVIPDAGPEQGGNQVLVKGSAFDTTTTVLFGGVPATDVQFVDSTLLVATVPAGTGDVDVVVEDDGDLSDPAAYSYDDELTGACPVLGKLDPDTGSHAGGYSVLAYGANLTPTTEIEFGVGNGNFSREVFFVSDNLLRVIVPRAFPEQIGATVDVGATNPLAGCTDVLNTVEFTWTAAQGNPPEIHYVDTTVEVPVTPTVHPALNVGGGDRMLVVGAFFDQQTTFDIEKPQGSGDSSDTVDVVVLSPNLAVMTSPASPDGLKGLAHLQAHNAFGSSGEFTVEYVEPPPPTILDVRNLDDGTTTAPIDANDRILIFGDSFFAPLTVKLTGCDLADQANQTTVTLTAPDVTLVEDHLIGVNIPANTFCEGPLEIEVTTPYGTAAFVDGEGDPVFVLIGPQPPQVDGVFPSRFNSNGGEEAVFFGRNLTDSTEFRVRTDPMPEGDFVKVLSTRYVSDTVAIVTMPGLPGGTPPTGVSGDVKAEELDPALRAKIAGDPFTVTEELFVVFNDDQPILLGVVPDHGTIDGGEQVLLLGANFLTAIGESNVSDVRFIDPVLGDIGSYTEAAPGDLPLDSLDPADRGKYVILNDHAILLITNPRTPISPEASVAPTDVRVESIRGDSELAGAYAYMNTPAVRTPFLLGITPNETRLNGGTSHLISGGFLTEADRIVFTRPGDSTTFTIPVDAGSFDEVNDNFLVFVMPDLSGTFDAGDVLDVHAEKDVGGSTLASNILHEALTITFAGPPIIVPDLDPKTGTAFGGTVVEITGSLFTTNSQVLFGTLPARYIVYDSPTRLLAITPALPVDVPNPGVDLRNIHTESGLVDVAVFTQGGWAVLAGGYEFKKAAPVVDDCAPDTVVEGGSLHVQVEGSNFVPGLTTATPLPGMGTVTNLVVHDFEHLSFDYAAPTFASGTAGPKTDSITIATNQGTAPGTCDITIQLTPFIDTVTTSYTPNDKAAPSTGVEGSSFVVVTLEGGNFMAGGNLVHTNRVGNAVGLVEIGSATPFSLPGQFRVADSGTIEFSAPFVFSNDVPTLIDGNGNVGPDDLAYTNPNGLGTAEPDAYSTVPTVIDFDDFSYAINDPDNDVSQLDRITVGDVNQDGVPDVVALTRNWRWTNPEAYLFMADTFGSLDVNGDGLTPDFAGTFTMSIIENDNAYTDMYVNGRGVRARLANLDSDDPLEIILPVNGHDHVVMIQDVKPDGSLGTQTFLDASSLASGARVSGLVVGTFHTGHSGPDIAVMIGGDSKSARKLIVFSSKSGTFAFDEHVSTLDSPFDEFRIGSLEAGDFDDDGVDELIWGQDDDAEGLTPREKDYPVVVADLDPTAGTLSSQEKLTNFSGGPVRDIEIYDIDGDGKDDAVVTVQNEAGGSLFTDTREGGFAVVLDPLGSLTANSYHESGFRDHTDEPFEGKGRLSTAADVNADGVRDILVASTEGEFTAFYGDGKGGFEFAGRTWTLPPSSLLTSSRIHGMDAVDMNHDGMAEVFMGDVGVAPMNLVLWLNISR